mmetsp:Transcript_1830/g.2699  ORF Transcript_1830/g.2699 Transcript_1830/m.2699 type:complete len:212 (-) Transcript_1830:145-780(-)
MRTGDNHPSQFSRHTDSPITSFVFLHFYIHRLGCRYLLTTNHLSMYILETSDCFSKFTVIYIFFQHFRCHSLERKCCQPFTFATNGCCCQGYIRCLKLPLRLTRIINLLLKWKDSLINALGYFSGWDNVWLTFVENGFSITTLLGNYPEYIHRISLRILEVLQWYHPTGCVEVMQFGTSNRYEMKNADLTMSECVKCRNHHHWFTGRRTFG